MPVALDNTFDYQLDEPAVIGQRVLVEFGKSRRVVGLIVNINDDDNTERDYEIKPVIAVLDDFSVVNTPWWELLRFASRYYAEPLGKALKNAFPKRLHEAKPLTQPSDVFFVLSTGGETALAEDSLPKSAKRQRRFLQALASEKSASLAQLRALDFAKSDVDKALANGYISAQSQSPYAESESVVPADYPLNDEQQQTIAAITETSDGFVGHLIEGVTGSGKTEVYIQLIEKAIADGGQVLLLVPEIGLTPQMLARFTARFGKRVASYHSGMSDIARRDVFLSAMSGDLPIVIGTRSAIFVPMANLRLILIDEEHDLSYKQQEGFLYHARDLALFRAKKLGINVVMGSATPSLESLHNVNEGKLQAHYLRKRATDIALPKIQLIDRRGHSREQVLANKVIQQMRQALQRGEQVLLFLNRRGFSPVMGCGNCDWRSDCPACSVFQTVHLQTRQLCCHHCGHVEPLPLHCPKCGDSDVFFVGAGTEKLESQLNQQFPQHTVLRLDRDKQTTAKQLDAALARVHAGEVDIILGTQLVVKGHHFPKVTTVCVVDADSALFSSDFRAEERLYQQLIQVAGRAGRESAGQVLVQTAVPEHSVYNALIKHDYHSYAETLLEERRATHLPPYAAVALLKASAKEQSVVIDYLRAIKNTLDEHAPQLSVLGPIPLAVAKVNHRYQAQLWLSADNKLALQKVLPLLRQIIVHFDRTNRFKTIIDVDAI